MKKLLHILCPICLALLLFGCSGGPRVIPRGKMAKIYAEMLVIDQWVINNNGFIRMADTSLVYEPILNKYGYTSEDYRASVECYMDDPERYSRILRTTSEILDARLQELKIQKQAIEEAKIVIKTDFKADDYFPYFSKEPYIHYFDSVSVDIDTIGCYLLLPVSCSDTVYDGLKIIVRADTLDVTKDSLAVTIDSVAVPSFRLDTNCVINPETKLFTRLSTKNRE